MSVQQSVKKGTRLERCFISSVVQYMGTNDIFRLMSTCKKFSNIPLSIRKNHDPIEVKTKTVNPSKIVPYKIYRLIETLNVYSYRDLFKIYFDIIEKSFELPVPNYFEVLGFIRMTDQFEYFKIMKLVNDWNTLKTDTLMTPDLRNQAIDTKEEEIAQCLIECKSIVDQNGVSLNMILNEYKKYFPRLTDISIELPRIKMLSNKKVYLFIKRFVDWYSRKLTWNTKSYIHSILNGDITREDDEKELQMITELINESEKDDLNIKNMVPPRYNCRDALEDERKDGQNLLGEGNSEEESSENSESEDDEDMNVEDRMIGDDGNDGVDWEQEEQFPDQQDDEHHLFLGNLFNRLNMMNFDVIDVNNIFGNAVIQDENEVFDETALSTIRNHENMIAIPNTWKVVPNEIFKDQYVKDVLLQNTIECLGNSSFERCRYLMELTIPASIQYIGISCFKDCISLSTVRFDTGSNLKWLGDRCFMNCVSLEKISLPNGLREAGTSCFEGCSELSTVELPKSLFRIGKWMFKDCSNLFKFENPNQIPWKKCDDPFDQTPYKLISLLAKFKK